MKEGGAVGGEAGGEKGGEPVGDKSAELLREPT